MMEEEKGIHLCYHSEKLAIAFGLLSIPPVTHVCIFRNLQACGDSHTSTKFMSQVVENPLTVRDGNCLRTVIRHRVHDW
jgi:hypothetical protein